MMFYLSQDNMISSQNYFVPAFVLNGIITVIDKQDKNSVNFGVALEKCLSDNCM